MSELRGVEIAVNDIKPYENNPRNNSKAIPVVAESIRKFGMRQPLVLDQENVIIIGHTRYCAAKYLGMKTVPCVIASDLTENQATALRLADNRLGELAQWDSELLSAEVAELAGSGYEEIFKFFDESSYSPEDMELDVKKMCTCPNCRYSGEELMFVTRR